MDTTTENNLLTKTFFYMFLGLLGTAIISFYVYSTELWIDIITNGYFNFILILEVIVVLIFNFLFKRLPPVAVTILFFIYSLLNGVTLSVIFLVFELQSIVLLFVISSLVFGGLALYGYKTNADLSNWRTILFGTLLAAIIISLINLFVGNSIVDIILNWVVLLVFFGITVYDMNKIKNLSNIETIDQEKLYIYGAMQLYLDFINIFLRILSIFGKRRN